MSGWNTLFDVANVAMNIGQSARLASQQKQLSAMQEQAAMEALRQQIIEFLREQVFQGGKQLKVLTEYKEEAPLAVYVAARTLGWKWDEMGITPEFFPEFRDKEYVQATLDQLNDTVQDAQSRLSASELDEGQSCVQAILQMPLLTEAGDLQAAKEGWIEANTTFRKLEKERSKHVKLGWMIAAASVALFFVMCLLNAIGASLIQKVFGDTQLPLGCIAFVINVLPFGGLIVALIIGGQGKTKEWNDAKARRQALQAKAAQKDKFTEIYETFGERTSQEYQTMRSEREALINRVLAGSEHFAVPAELQ